MNSLNSPITMIVNNRAADAKTDLAVSAKALEFRKTNEAIGIRVSEGRLSLLSRKLFNVMVYNAQKLGVPGMNAPIETETAKQFFWIPLADVARDAAYDSNDTKQLKDHIEELQSIKITLENHREWTSETLVSSVKLVNPSGLRKKGGVMWLGFAFPPEVAALVMNPGTYTKLSIYYQTMLRSGSSLALYEICRRYATNPSKKTSMQAWEWWYECLTGLPIGGPYPEYKYFKRDVVKPAIVEINAVTDIDVELIESKQGRRIIDLQFAVQQKKQPSLEFPPKPVIDADLVLGMVKFGISQEEARNLCAMHGEEKLRAILGAVRDRVAAKNSPPVDSPAAYFRWSLKHGVTPSKGVAMPSVVLMPGQTREATMQEQFIARRCRDAIGYFQELDPARQSELLERFKVTQQGRAVSIDKGLRSPLVRSALGLWLSDDLWGRPTDAEIVEFAAARAAA